MMQKTYTIRRNGRRLASLGVHDSYEKARQAIRKYLRKTVRDRGLRHSMPGVWDSISRNPTDLGGMGFKIVRQ
jgi:hypothetical protein